MKQKSSIKFYLLNFLIGIIILITTAPWAYGDMPYYVYAYDASAIYNGIGEARGSTGYNYVMQTPVHIANATHLNSTYIWRSSNDMVEIGWVKQYGWTYTYSFWALQQYGSYEGGPDGKIGSVTNGANYNFKVAVDVPKTTSKERWWWIINGVKKLDRQLWFGRGFPDAGSEKDRVSESNYAHWWNLQLKKSQGDYRSWLNLKLESDTDPYYWLNKVSNTEFFVRS